MYRSLDSFDPTRGSFSTWIHRITVNRCLNWRRGRPATDQLESAESQAAESVDSPAESLADSDFVGRALGGLSEKLRVVVVLRHYWGLSYAEIAETLDLPLGTVKSRLSLAMQQMKDQLEPGPQDQGYLVEAQG